MTNKSYKMKILGIRNYSEGIRYCILESNFNCCNLNKENFIRIPKEYENKEDDMLVWYESEIARIIDNNHEIGSIALKHNENLRSDCYANLKKVMFMDCLVTFVAKKRNIQFSSYAYNQLGVNSKNVQNIAESKLGQTEKKWDKNMADAMIVALKQIEKICL